MSMLDADWAVGGGVPAGSVLTDTPGVESGVSCRSP